VNTVLLTGLAAGGLLGAGVAVVVAGVLRWHPDLTDALALLDERLPHPTEPTSTPAARSGRPGWRGRVLPARLLRLARRLPGAVDDADLDVLDLDRDRYLARAITTAVGYAAAGPALAAVLLIVDALADFGQSEGVGGAESSLDVTVRAAAALADQYVGAGDRVSLRVLSPGGQYAGYGTGTRHLRRILIVLSRIRPGFPRDVAIDQIDFRTAAGTVVVVISPMLSESIATATVRLVRRGLPVIVVDPLPPRATPTAYPDSDEEVASLAWRMRLLDRGHLLAQLSAAGCPVVPWNGPRTLEEVLRRLARRGQLPRVGGA
jgi:hypothetical protein